MHQKMKKGLGYLTEMTVDTQHSIITGMDCYPANRRESDIILNHLKIQPCNYQKIALDGGYDIGAVHKGLELLGVDGYTAVREYQKIIYKKSTQNYYRMYGRSWKVCKGCPCFSICATDLGTVRKLGAPNTDE